jgi:ATPase subunit of ABC transporter with duplicated ATPase domains
MMTKGTLDFENVAFYYESAAEPLFDALTCRFSTGWTGIIGPNGSGKTTLLRLACAQLFPVAGSIRSPQRVIYCQQRTDDPPKGLASFLVAPDPPACELRGRLSVGDDWLDRWETLSHGERKRAQIAVALWRKPGVLALDEPTNHIDIVARGLLGGALKSFKGIGLLVSHDRDLLDSLSTQTLFVEPPGVVMRPGGYTKATELAHAEHARTVRLRGKVKADLQRLRQVAADRARQASRSHRLRSKRGLKPKQHDARERIGRARYTAKDAQAGRLLRQLDGRLDQLQATLDGTHVKKQRRLGIDMTAARSKRDFLFRVPGGSLGLGEKRKLTFPDLSMGPDDRVALVGPNGSGKSTLIRHIVGRLELLRDKLVYLSQEIDLPRSVAVLAAVRALRKNRLGEVMTVVSCLGSDPQRLLQSDVPSPGEVRKLILALGIARRPHLIIMDEPTNHLDLPSIECVEDALAQCPCGVLLVSHDVRFLQRLTRTWWRISPEDEKAGPHTMRLTMEDRGVNQSATI